MILTFGDPTVARYYWTARAVMVAIALTLAAVSGACPPWFAAISGIISWAMLHLLGRGLSPSLLLRAGFVIGGVVLGGMAFVRSKDILFFFSYFLVAAIPFALGLKDRFNAHWLTGLSAFLTALIGLVAGNATADYLGFFAFAGSVVFFLNSGHLYHHMGPAEALSRRIPHRYFLSFLLSVAGGMWVGVALFVLFPRSIQWSNPFGLRNIGERTTGYSGKASLDEKGPSEDTTLALIVESEEPPWLASVAGHLHLRGNALEKFDGVKWTSDYQRTRALGNVAALEYTAASARRLRKLRLFREPHTTPAVLYPGVLRQIDAPSTLLGGLRWDRGGNLLRGREGLIRYTYEILITPLVDVWDSAETDVRKNRERLAAPLTTWTKDREALQEDTFLLEHADIDDYLQVPRELAQAPYFQAWIKEVGIDPKKQSLREVMDRLSTFFQKNFQAVLSHEFSKENQLKGFLTTDRRGHCQYFATVAALHLRSLGVPTRIVLGYRGGQYNPVSGVLEVRESNAHAWVEVMGPGVGWLTFDPTPVILAMPGNEWYRPMVQYFTAAKYWFERYVVDYNSATQKELFHDLARWGKSPKIDWTWVKRWDTWLPLLLCVGAIGWLVWRRRRGSGHHAPLPRYYRLFQRRARGAGFERRTGETFAAFHGRLVAQDESTAKVLEVVDAALERDLYASGGLPDVDSRRLESVVRRSALRFRH